MKGRGRVIIKKQDGERKGERVVVVVVV